MGGGGGGEREGLVDGDRELASSARPASASSPAPSGSTSIR
jgi:hypothetical protein